MPPNNHPSKRKSNPSTSTNPDSSRPPDHPSRKQEKALVAVCLVVAAFMLLSLSRYIFR